MQPRVNTSGDGRLCLKTVKGPDVRSFQRRDGPAGWSSEGQDVVLGLGLKLGLD